MEREGGREEALGGQVSDSWVQTEDEVLETLGRPWWVREGSQRDGKDVSEGITGQQEKASVRKNYTSQGQEGLDSCRSQWCTRWLRGACHVPP